MATIAQAIAAKTLEVVPLPAWEKRQTIRALWATPELLDWIEGSTELSDPKNTRGKRTLYEHLWQFFAAYRCSARPGAGDLHTMLPTKKGVWTMRPPALRIYGFCSANQSFVAVTWAFEQETKVDKSLNDKKRDEVLKFIKDNNLEGTVKYGTYDAIFPN
jgi:hypothetical protein